MTPTIHWPTDHSPITHTDPPDPPNPPRTHLTWPFLHFMTFYTIQTKYFLKPHDTQYPLTHWPLTHDPHRPTKPTIWPSESRKVEQRLVFFCCFFFLASTVVVVIIEILAPSFCFILGNGYLYYILSSHDASMLLLLLVAIPTNHWHWQAILLQQLWH